MKKKKKLTIFDIVVLVLATLIVFVTLYPMIYVVACSISDPKAVLAGKVKLLPVGFSMEAYRMVFSNADFLRSILNSVGYVIANCVLMFFTTVLFSYPLTRPNLKFRKLIVFFMLVPMYFGGGMIPSFILITKLGLYNSPFALIIPCCVGIGNVILCRTFMATLPGDLIDAAFIDGSDQFGTLFRIMIPLSKPVLAVIMIYTIVGVWNSWFSASIYTTKTAFQPVQLYLKRILEASQGFNKEMMASMTLENQKRYIEMQLSGNQLKYAMIVVTTAPIILVYPMFQKHFTKGIMLGSLKG